MIYDKAQRKFNYLFLMLLITILAVVLILGNKMVIMEQNYNVVNDSLKKIDEKFNYNNIQASHNNIDYSLTNFGLNIQTANDYGQLSGPSMQPAIFDGNTVIQIKYQQGMPLNVGDIVRYQNKQGIGVIHRIRGVYASTVFIQGDNSENGEIVPKTKITHKIIGVLYT